MLGINIQRVAIIIRKEILVLLSDNASRFLIFVAPIMQIILFGWAATLEVKNVDVAVVNHDEGLWSREIIHRIQGAPTFKHVRWLNGEKAMKKELDNQKALFIMVFDQEFSRNIEKGMPAEMQLLLDGRRSNTAQIASSYVNQIISNVAQTTPMYLVRPNLGLPNAPPLLDIRTRCWFNPNLEFQWFFLPNLIGIISIMLGLIITGLSVAREKEVGTFDQLLVSPATPTEIALAKLAPGCIIALVQGTFFLLIAVYGFGVPVNGSVGLLYIAMLVFAFASGGVGLMVSSISSTQQQAFLGAFTIGIPCVLISGAVTPIANMPAFLQHASQLNPMTHFTTICQGVFLKDITFNAALINLGKMAICSIITAGISIWMFQRRQ